MDRLIGLSAIVWILALSWYFSVDRKAIPWRTVVVGLVSQVLLAATIIRGDVIAGWFVWLPVENSWLGLAVAVQLAVLWFLKKTSLWNSIARYVKPVHVYWVISFQFVLLVLKANLIGGFFSALSAGAGKLLAYSTEGAAFVFGPLGSSQQLREIFSSALGEKIGSFTVLFAFQILPTIIFVASLFAVLYYLKLMQPVVRVLGVAMQRTLSASGAESLDVAANIFMGQTEAPLTILPYLSRTTRSELFTIMVSGLAHVSAGILLAYAAVAGVDPKHLIASVVMVSPGSILLAKIWFPEKEQPLTAGGKIPEEKADGEGPVNVVDAAARGAGNGLTLAANVGAMLIAFIALIALLNGIWSAGRETLLSFVENNFGTAALVWVSWLPQSLQQILGYLFSPIAVSLGVPFHEAVDVGNLLGTRLVLNEFVAYVQLGPLKEILSEKSFVIATYMLCGFGNISSVAIQVGGLGALIPQRRKDLADLGMRAVLVGTMANLMAAAIAGMMV